MKMRLTIAIPTVNRAYCIRRAVESALAQTPPDIEILVSNNASTDDTRRLLEELANERRDPRLRVIHHGERLPVTAHGNFLVASARGEFFLGLSDDDWVEARFAERVLSLFESRSGLAFVYARCQVHVGDLVLPSPTGPEVEDSVDFLEAYFAGRRQVYWCACVTRTADLRRLAPIPPDRLIGDMYFWTKLALEGPVGFVPEYLSHYTYLADNSSIGIPVAAWARETAVLGEEVTAGLSRAGVEGKRMAAISAAIRCYVGRSTANQVVLNAQRGASKRVLLSTFPEWGPHLLGDLTGLPRVAAALVFPPTVLRRLTRAFAAGRAERQIATKGAGSPSGSPTTE